METEVRHHSRFSAFSSKGLTQPIRRKSSGGHILVDLNSKWGHQTQPTLRCKGLQGQWQPHTLWVWEVPSLVWHWVSDPSLHSVQGHTQKSFVYFSDSCLFVSLPLLIGIGWRKWYSLEGKASLAEYPLKQLVMLILLLTWQSGDNIDDVHTTFSFLHVPGISYCSCHLTRMMFGTMKTWHRVAMSHSYLWNK